MVACFADGPDPNARCVVPLGPSCGRDMPPDRRTARQVKDVARLSSSPQLRDLVGFGQGQGRGVPVEIFTNAMSPQSGQLYNWIRSGQVISSPL